MSMPAFHYPLVAFVLLSCLLNLAIIFGILRFRRTNPYLKGSYFALVIFHGAADILLSCEFTLLMRARKYRYLDFVLTENSTLWHVLPWITNGLHYYLKAVLYMGHILLSFNRFTSAFYPLHYEMFWKSKIMIFARFFAWAIPLFFVSPIVLNFNYEMWFSMGENNETVRLQSDDVSTQLLSYVDASLTLSATTICLIFYALSAVKISRQMLKHGIQQKHSVEIRLFLSSFFLFILLSVNTIIQVWTIVASKQGHNDMVMKLNDVSYPVLDAMYSANPWVLFITSSAIRDAVIRLLLPFRYYKASQIMVVSSFTSVLITHRRMPMPMFHYFLTGFAIASVFLNAIIIMAIVKHRRTNPILRGSYFSLIIFHASADILLACCTAILMRARKYRYLDFMLVEGNALWIILPWVTNFLNYYLKGVIYLGHILLSTNRFTSVFFPLKYESFWDSKLMKLICMFAWIAPSFFYLPIVLNFNYQMWFSIGTNNETVRLQMDDESTQLISYMDGGLSFSATIICLVFYVFSAFKISRQMMRHGIHKSQSMEIRLFVASVIQFLLLSFTTANQVWTLIASKQGSEEIVMWLYDLSYPILDMLYSVNPWILCLTSSAIRDAIRRLLLPLKNRVSSIQVPSSASPSSAASVLPNRPQPST